MRFDIATLFPEVCEAVVNSSIIGRGIKAGKLGIDCLILNLGEEELRLVQLVAGRKKVSFSEMRPVKTDSAGRKAICR